MVDYDPATATPTQTRPFEDLPSTSTPVRAAWLNHVDGVLVDVAGSGGRVKRAEATLRHSSTVRARVDVDPDAYTFAAADLVSCPVPTYDGSGQVVHPSVLFFPEGWNGHRYWMAITPYTGLNAEVENPSIVVSDDGTTWSVPAGVTNPLVPSPSGDWYNSDPHLTFGPDGLLYLFFREVREGPGTEYIKYMTSANGITWSAPVQTLQLTIATETALSPAVWWDAAAGQWVMLAVDISPTDSTRLLRRTTTNLLGGWSSATTVPVSPAVPGGRGIWHLDAHPVGGQIVMLLSDHSLGVGWGTGFLYFAVSDDQGRTFRRGSTPYGVDPTYYRSSIVPMLRDDGLGFDTWIGTLSTLSRVSTSRRTSGGVTDHGALTGLGDDDHPQYLTRATVDAKGDLLVATAPDTVTRLPATGVAGRVLTEDPAEAAGMKWATPSAGGGGGQSQILVPARLLETSPIAAPTYARTGNGLWPVYVFNPDTNQGVIGAQLIPTSTTTDYVVRVHWCNVGAGSGDVRWEVTCQSFSAAGTAGPERVTVAAPTAAGQYTPQTVVTGTITLDPTHTLLHVRLWRLATDGTDTLPNDAAVIAISLTPAT